MWRSAFDRAMTPLQPQSFARSLRPARAGEAVGAFQSLARWSCRLALTECATKDHRRVHRPEAPRGRGAAALLRPRSTWPGFSRDRPFMVHRVNAGQDRPTWVTVLPRLA